MLSGKHPYAQYDLDSTAVIALLQRDERPSTKPMFSSTGTPYYRGWRAAIHCWARDPARRLPMAAVALMLRPVSGATREIDAGAAESRQTTRCYCEAYRRGNLLQCSAPDCQSKWVSLAFMTTLTSLQTNTRFLVSPGMSWERKSADRMVLPGM